MVEASTTVIVQLFMDWEIQLLMLLSFVLQLFLFFFGGLRRHNNNMLLSLLLWLAYLIADYIAVYALGYLSRNLPNITTDNAKLSQARSSQTQQLTLLWAPFLLIHLGGQDTVTAFSIEDNELWLRHLLNLLVQVCLVLRVLWNSLAYDQLVVPTVFVFFTGIIKYGERIWALKCGSQKSLKSSNRGEVVKQLPKHQDATELTYPTVVKYALHTQRGLRDVFAGRKFYNTGLGDEQGYDIYRKFLFRGREEDVQLDFKRAEIELSIMYDDLFTKAGVIQTRLGAILRCVSLTSTMVAFVLFIVTSARQRYRYTRVDAVITYVLFIGAFCLEACAVLVVMTSPRAWAILEARCPRLARVCWSILVRVQPETRPWWSNSIGQYNLLSSYMADKNSSMLSTVIAKMMGMVGAIELWNNIRHTKHAKVTMETKKLIHQLINWEWNRMADTGLHRLGQPLMHDSMRQLKQLFKLPFEEALFVLHVLTDVLLYRVGMPVTEVDITEDIRSLMDTCKGISDYMFYLLVVNPAMLPVSSRARDLLAQTSESLRAIPASSKKQFLEAFSSIGHGILADANNEKIPMLLQKAHRLLPEQSFHEALQMLAQVWVRLLVYAAGKSRPEEHARRLSMGGDLLTFVWLLMAHRELGDVCYEVNLIPTKQSGAFLFG